jgi:Acyl-coenzyme A synthetases/AMP-(fatty) acid ligases
VRRVINNSELEMIAVNLPDGKKGEEVVLMVAGDIDISALKQQLIAAQCNPLMIPSQIYSLPEVPRLGSGKTNFKEARRIALKLCAP